MLVTSNLCICFDVIILLPLLQNVLLYTWHSRLTMQSNAMLPSRPSRTVPYAMPRWDRGIKRRIKSTLGPYPHQYQNRRCLASAYGHVPPSRGTRPLTHIYSRTHTATHYPPSMFRLEGIFQPAVIPPNLLWNSAGDYPLSKCTTLGNFFTMRFYSDLQDCLKKTNIKHMKSSGIRVWFP